MGDDGYEQFCAVGAKEKEIKGLYGKISCNSGITRKGKNN